jgi:3-methyladenine DNA glycosylase/8-oxoguanine DNA glycosylase
VALRGIGAWTAEWFLARHLARPHAWPAGDLALRKAVVPLDVVDAGIRFHPFQNLSAHYLLLANRVP